MKIVLDTNVWISGLLFPGGIPDRIVRAALTGRISNATSPDLLMELRRVLKRAFSLSEERVAELVEIATDASLLVYPTERLSIITNDETDNRVLECAVTARVEAIVTGDHKHLLPRHSYRGILIRSPADFIRMFDIP